MSSKPTIIMKDSAAMAKVGVTFDQFKDDPQAYLRFIEAFVDQIDQIWPEWNVPPKIPKEGGIRDRQLR